jgi:hypothetical protein
LAKKKKERKKGNLNVLKKKNTKQRTRIKLSLNRSINMLKTNQQQRKIAKESTKTGLKNT